MNHSRPVLLTFTGIDETADLDHAGALAETYPIEWGVLFSPDRQGKDPRFPPLAFIEELTKWAQAPSRHGKVRLAAHLCGGHAKAVLAGEPTGVEWLLKGPFGRFQVNTATPNPSTAKVRDFAAAMDPTAQGILQCRAGFPADGAVEWLFDRSGGLGRTPDEWPDATGLTGPVGYAGGLGPETVGTALAAIRPRMDDGQAFWLDMESNVRTGDGLDLRKCESVCRHVYGGTNGR